MNNLTIIVGSALGSVITVLLIILLFLKRKQKKNDRIDKKVKKGTGSRNRLYILYLVFRRTPLLSKYFDKVLKETEAIYPADQMSVNKKATSLMLRNLIIAALIFIFMIIVSQGDVFYISMGALSAAVMFDYMTSSSLRNMEAELLRQLQSFLSDIRHYYMQSKVIEDAVNDTLDDIPFEISLHIQKLYSILVSPIMEEKVEEYAGSNPNRFFMLLTSICTVVKEYGDSEVEGGSNFLNSLAYLKEEVNIELLKKQMIDYRFKALSMMALIPVVFLKPIEAWSKANMPDLTDFYAGVYGKAIMIFLFFLSFICYKLVEILKDTRRGDLIKTSIWQRVARIPVINRITNKLINRYFTRAMRVNDMQKEVGDLTGPKALLVQSLAFSLAAFILVNFMFTTTVVANRMTMIKNFIGNFDETIVPNENYLKNMQNASNEYAELYKKINPSDIDEEQLTAEIRQSTSVKDKDSANLVAQAVISQVKAYQNTYYKWYHLLISIAAAVIAFFGPYIYMRFKIKVQSVNKTDEVNQFQTLVLILMHTDGITLDVILEWMDRFSYSFKASIETCIIELESGERQALERMKRSETFQDFKRFVDCLLEIDQVGVVQAFDEVSADRTYSLKNREQENQIITEDRASKAFYVSYTPLMVEFALYLIGPMVIMAVKMFLAMDFSI